MLQSIRNGVTFKCIIIIIIKVCIGCENYEGITLKALIRIESSRLFRFMRLLRYFHAAFDFFRISCSVSLLTVTSRKTRYSMAS